MASTPGNLFAPSNLFTLGIAGFFLASIPAANGQSTGNQNLGRQNAGHQVRGNRNFGGTAQNGQARQPITRQAGQQQFSQGQQPLQAGVRRNQQTVTNRAPQGFPLKEAHQQYVDKCLMFWESSSSKIDRLRCNFTRRKFDSTVLQYIHPQNKQLVPHEISKGNIQFGKPDKALVAVEMKSIVHPPSATIPELQVKPLQTKMKDGHKERWICNGKTILYFDYIKQQVIRSQIPADMQGSGLKNSPLPFFFGAKADELKARYWIRTINPPGVKNQWWLEFHPKRRQDAEFYSKTVVILEGQSFLPKTIQMFKPLHNPNKVKLADGSIRPAIIQYDVYDFETREVNFREGLVKLWNDSFNPRTPFGWREVTKTLGPQQQNPAVRHAQTPGTMRK